MSDKRIRPSRCDRRLGDEEWQALKAMGYSEEELQADQRSAQEDASPFGPVVFAYTRAQAIEDGVLVDATAVARRLGFTIPVALTAGAAEALVDLVRRRRPQDLQAHPLERVRSAAIGAMLLILRDAIADGAGRGEDRLAFTCDDVALWAHVGPGDTPAPVLTVMLPGED